MWVVILVGLVIYKLLRRFFSDDVFSEASDTEVLLSVATRLEKLFGGKAYTGLRIPDPDSGSRQNIDLVLLTKWEAMVISVNNYSGVVSVASDGSWVCFDPGREREERYPDPVATAHKKALVLEAYLEQRGVVLPEGFLSWKVILPNPKFCTLNASILSSLPSEIITYGQWEQLKPEQKKMLPRWMKGAFCGVKKEMQETVHQQLGFILSTAPMWDRLELKGNKFLLGEFTEFKGKQDDVLALRAIRRSKVNRLLVQKTSMFGLAPRWLQVLYTPRDYRSEGASSSEWKEATGRNASVAPGTGGMHQQAYLRGNQSNVNCFRWGQGVGTEQSLRKGAKPKGSKITNVRVVDSSSKQAAGARFKQHDIICKGVQHVAVRGFQIAGSKNFLPLYPRTLNPPPFPV